MQRTKFRLIALLSIILPHEQCQAYSLHPHVAEGGARLGLKGGNTVVTAVHSSEMNGMAINQDPVSFYAKHI
jgi:hypothetical protein